MPVKVAVNCKLPADCTSAVEGATRTETLAGELWPLVGLWTEVGEQEVMNNVTGRKAIINARLDIAADFRLLLDNALAVARPKGENMKYPACLRTMFGEARSSPAGTLLGWAHGE